MNMVSERELLEYVEQYMDDVCSDIFIFGMRYTAFDVLKHVDPIAFSVICADLESDLIAEDIICEECECWTDEYHAASSGSGVCDCPLGEEE